MSRRATFIDLFCGAGGLSDGLRQAGFTPVFALDFDEASIRTYRLNHPDTLTHLGAIEEVHPAQLRRQLNLERGELMLLAGGPPCQGFSINAPKRLTSDPRNTLINHYFNFLDEFQPALAFFENVPGMVQLGEGRFFRKVVRSFEELGYNLASGVLCAAGFGVPQLRWRFIAIASRKRSLDLPNYKYSFEASTSFFPKEASARTRFTGEEMPVITVGEAIGDLPDALTASDEAVQYNGRAPSFYAMGLRSVSGRVYNHVGRKLGKVILERMNHVPPGGSWRDIPTELLTPGMKRANRECHTRRYGKLCYDAPSWTILTQVSPHWGTFVLPDKDRTLTVREAARLQSFRDDFRFTGKLSEQYRQVGNAVPPLLARAVGSHLLNHLFEG